MKKNKMENGSGMIYSEESNRERAPNMIGKSISAPDNKKIKEKKLKISLD